MSHGQPETYVVRTAGLGLSWQTRPGFGMPESWTYHAEWSAEDCLSCVSALKDSQTMAVVSWCRDEGRPEIVGGGREQRACPRPQVRHRRRWIRSVAGKTARDGVAREYKLSLIISGWQNLIATTLPIHGGLSPLSYSYAHLWYTYSTRDS